MGYVVRVCVWTRSIRVPVLSDLQNIKIHYNMCNRVNVNWNVAQKEQTWLLIWLSEPVSQTRQLLDLFLEMARSIQQLGRSFVKYSNNLFYNLFWYWDKRFCNFPSFDWSETAAECSSLSCISLVLPHQQFQDLFVWNRRKICCSIKPVLQCDFGWDGIFYWVWRCHHKEFF